MACENCGNIVPTGYAISRDSKGATFANDKNQCRVCKTVNTLNAGDVFYIDKIPIE